MSWSARRSTVPREDPFAGIQLSEQATPGKLEQRLFERDTPRPTPTAANQDPEHSPKKIQLPVRTTSVPTKIATAPGALKALELSKSRFNLADVPLFKASYLFTQEELNLLEDLKIALRRELDAKVTKNDLMRLALHLLLEDHRLNGSRSYASRKVRKG
jgi:hypothetical protein